MSGLIFVERGSPEWDHAWSGLALLDPKGDTVAEHCGECWQYMGTVVADGRPCHEFRHRMHPSDGQRTYHRVPASECFDRNSPRPTR